MRNRILTLAVVAGLLGLPVLVRGQDPSVGGSGGKVGVINLQLAIANTAEGKQALAELQKKYEPKRDDLQRKQEEISSLQDQLNKQSATLSDEERLRLAREIEEKQRLFKREQDDAQSDFQADQQDLFQRIGQKMVKVIDNYAQQNNLALVIDGSALNIYYLAKGVDITEPIVKLYDAANPVAAAAASSTSTRPSSAAPANAKPHP